MPRKPKTELRYITSIITPHGVAKVYLEVAAEGVLYVCKATDRRAVEYAIALAGDAVGECLQLRGILNAKTATKGNNS